MSTMIEQQTTSPQQQAHDTFTLKFVGGQIAVLEVRGATSKEEARAVASEALPGCRYEIVDGDQSNGQAAVFYAWSCSRAQERQPKPQQRGGK